MPSFVSSNSVPKSDSTNPPLPDHPNSSHEISASEPSQLIMSVKSVQNSETNPMNQLVPASNTSCISSLVSTLSLESAPCTASEKELSNLVSANDLTSATVFG